jgi:HK97 family phage major capsid protein
MAIAAARTTGDFAGFLNRRQAQPIFERAARVSVAQRLAREVPLGGNGEAIPVVTGRLTAGWVAEGGQKPASQGTLALKTMDPKKISVIAVVSAEVVRANPGGYMDLIRPQVAEAFALGFDLAAFHDIGPDGTAGAGPFPTFIDQTAKSVELGTASQATGGVYKDLVSVLSLLTADTKRLTGWALDDIVEAQLLGAVDLNGRPLFVDIPTDATTAGMFDGTGVQPARQGRLLGRPSFMNQGVATPNLTSVVGYGGDWSQAAWGAVGGISYDVSTEATVTINGALVSLWENNLVAVRAEAEYGWLVNDTASFVKLTNAA